MQRQTFLLSLQAATCCRANTANGAPSAISNVRSSQRRQFAHPTSKLPITPVHARHPAVGVHLQVPGALAPLAAVVPPSLRENRLAIVRRLCYVSSYPSSYSSPPFPHTSNRREWRRSGDGQTDVALCVPWCTLAHASTCPSCLALVRRGPPLHASL
jgi:hypothetical protein